MSCIKTLHDKNIKVVPCGPMEFDSFLSLNWGYPISFPLKVNTLTVQPFHVGYYRGTNTLPPSKRYACSYIIPCIMSMRILEWANRIACRYQGAHAEIHTIHMQMQALIREELWFQWVHSHTVIVALLLTKSTWGFMKSAGPNQGPFFTRDIGIPREEIAFSH